MTEVEHPLLMLCQGQGHLRQINVDESTSHVRCLWECNNGYIGYMRGKAHDPGTRVVVPIFRVSYLRPVLVSNSRSS